MEKEFKKLDLQKGKGRNSMVDRRVCRLREADMEWNNIKAVNTKEEGILNGHNVRKCKRIANLAILRPNLQEIKYFI